MASGQALVRSIPKAVDRFKELIKDDELVRNGQFIWAVRYEKVFGKLVRSIVTNARPAVQSVWRPRGREEFGDELIRLAGASRRAGDNASREFEKRVSQVAADARWQDGSLQATRLLALLKDSGSGGAQAYETATLRISQGQRVRLAAGSPKLEPREAAEASKNFRQVFAETKLSFRGVLRVNQVSAESCFKTSRAVARFVVKKGGLLRKPIPSDSPGQVFDQSGGFVSFRPPLHDLVAFTPTLGNSMRIASNALDNGCLLNAPVLSGETLNGPDLFQSDHAVLILAWEIRANPFDHHAFGFWDPDARVTNAIEPGFGLLFFLDKSVAPKRAATGPDVGTPRKSGAGAPYAASFYRTGRFTTALNENALGTVEDTDGDDVNGQHRYQVISLEAIPVKVRANKK